MEQVLGYAAGTIGLIALFGFIFFTTCDVKSLRNKIVYKLLNMWYNIYVLK